MKSWKFQFLNQNAASVCRVRPALLWLWFVTLMSQALMSEGSDIPAQPVVGTQSHVLEYGFGIEHEQPVFQHSSSSKGHAVISGTV